ncbi:CSS-motif domain-containing protein, partial [Salmonella enterica]|nr:CSS-motif domain-containing protein [Salmonella enterica]
MLTRDSSSGRKILLTCIITGIAAALLIGSLQFFLSWHKRDVKYNTLLSDVQHYLASYFADLKATTDILQPLTINTCQQVGAELTSRAAFSLNVRAFLLIKDKKVFCSSATGAMNMPLQQLVPD